jgi:FAD:protein FMN transferase
MSKPEPEKSNRREFLTGVAGRKQLRQVGDKIADRITERDDEPESPATGPMVRLSVDAMACEFAISMNPGSSQQLSIASGALEQLEPLEQTMTIYRDSSELTRVNQNAFTEKQNLSDELYRVLKMCLEIYEETNGAFDPTMGPLISLWRKCRGEKRLPDDSEIVNCLAESKMQDLILDHESNNIQFLKESVSLDLGGIGKGFAIDQVVPSLLKQGLQDFLFHGGHSSLYAHGIHHHSEGWPVGIRNPLLIEERLATILIKNQAMSTSGSNAQYYRFQGKRYGHILDPRTGHPSEKLLSAVVVAPSAAIADALSTAFFVMGVDDSVEYCRNHTDIGVILVPKALSGRKISPIIIGIPESQLFFHQPERDLDSVDFI